MVTFQVKKIYPAVLFGKTKIWIQNLKVFFHKQDTNFSVRAVFLECWKTQFFDRNHFALFGSAGPQPRSDCRRTRFRFRHDNWLNERRKFWNRVGTNLLFLDFTLLSNKNLIHSEGQKRNFIKKREEKEEGNISCWGCYMCQKFSWMKILFTLFKIWLLFPELTRQGKITIWSCKILDVYKKRFRWLFPSHWSCSTQRRFHFQQPLTQLNRRKYWQVAYVIRWSSSFFMFVCSYASPPTSFNYRIHIQKQNFQFCRKEDCSLLPASYLWSAVQPKRMQQDDETLGIQDVNEGRVE